MYLYRIFPILILLFCGAFSQAQTALTTVSFEVAGNCAMCKKRIEKAGKEAGAQSIEWSQNTHLATVKVDTNKVSIDHIKKQIAAAGHDTDTHRAADEIYEVLHECCLYERLGEDDHDHEGHDHEGHKHDDHDHEGHDHDHEGHDHAGHDHAKHDEDGGHNHDHDHEVTGVVVDENDKGDLKPIAEVTVYWADEPAKKVKTNENGVFKIMHVKPFRYLVISHAGMQSDTVEVKNLHDIVVVQAKNNVLKEIVISRRQKSNYISKLTPNRIETLTAKELFKAACCDLSESFTTTASVDVVSSDAVTGSKQIQMLGLSGIYTQLTVEGLPGPRAFSAPLGLNSIAGTWIEAINISKGIGSVANGFENMAGQINIELKKPHNSEKLFLNAYANNMGRTDINLNLAHHLNEKWSVGLLLHDNFMYNKKMNFSDNGFRDIPVGNLFSGINRWHYENGKGVIAQFGVKFLHDDRIGGQVDFNENTDKFGQNRYGLGFNNQRIEGFGKLGYVFADNKHRSIGLQLSASRYKQESFFGHNTYDNEQKSMYANLLYQDILGSVAHKYKVGVSVQHDDLDEEIGRKTQQQQDYLLNFGRKETTTGAFAEYTFSPSENFDAVLGLRQDYNNLYGWFTTPRAVLRYQPALGTTLRLSSGRGQRTANIFAENLGIFASSRVIQDLVGLTAQPNAYGLKPEVSWNTGITIDQNFQLFGRESGISVELFHNNFENQVVIDWEESQKVSFYNLQGKSYSNSIQAEFRFMPMQHFEARMAYRMLDVKTDYESGRLEKPLNAKHRGFLNLAYNLHSGWSFDYTVNAVGTKRLPQTASTSSQQTPTRSDAYVTMNAQVSRSFGKNKNFDLYVGAENFTNYYQKDPILAYDDPFGANFDTNLVWGPITGRMFYTGIRYHIK